MLLETLRLTERDAIIKLARRHGASNVRVFGSVARREERPNSDVDFLVDLEEGRTLFDLAALRADLRELLDAPVDLVEATCLHPYIRDRVLAEALAL